MASRRKAYGPKRYSAKAHLSVERVRLNSGGYDRHGRYYGSGAPLYHVSGETSTGRYVDEVVRAPSAAAARAMVSGRHHGTSGPHSRDKSRGKKRASKKRSTKKRSASKKRSRGAVRVKAYKVSSYKRKAPKRSRKSRRK
jgi:hypothetical protein